MPVKQPCCDGMGMGHGDTPLEHVSRGSDYLASEVEGQPVLLCGGDIDRAGVGITSSWPARHTYARCRRCDGGSSPMVEARSPRGRRPRRPRRSSARCWVPGTDRGHDGSPVRPMDCFGMGLLQATEIVTVFLAGFVWPGCGEQQTSRPNTTHMVCLVVVEVS